ncbi:unnamed protein product [Ranitomeya imitator]|uniref:Uncharacterized protein n=1 Tax=Ranitomeya imitator TaxID=111125 RepID=A0ABN9LU65_9NEOB|nr:unnamed protein product [Ranitomeya imitator]
MDPLQDAVRDRISREGSTWLAALLAGSDSFPATAQAMPPGSRRPCRATRPLARLSPPFHSKRSVRSSHARASSTLGAKLTSAATGGQMPDLAITRVQRPFEDQAHAGYLTKVIANSMASVNTNMSAQFAEDPILQLNVHKLPKKQITVRQPPLAKLTTPVNVKRMGPWLDKYPNKSAMAQLHFGFSFGFFIPFNFLHEPQLAPNLKSARESPGILSDKLNKEIKLGRFKGPFKTHPFSNL